jgi:flagellar motor switch protein FliM
MSSPGTPAETRAYIVERLVGDTGEPDHVIEAARNVAERALEPISEGLAMALSGVLALELKTVELARLAEARPAEGTRAAMVVVASSSSPDALVMTIDAQAVAILLNVMFGGDPDLPVAPIERDFSAIELEVAALALNEFAKGVNGSGARSMDIRFPLPALVSSAVELKKLVLRDGPAVRACFSIGAGSSPGRVDLYMPQRVLLKHRGRPGAAGSQEEPAQPGEWQASFGKEVMRSGVRLEATMPLGAMTLDELTGLTVGQIIELPVEARSEARLLAKGNTLFVCEFGRLGQNYTVRVRHPFDAGQDLMDNLLPAS